MTKSELGLTLVELIAAIVILAVALSGVAVAIRGSLNRAGAAPDELRAAALAQAYLDEILGKRFDENSGAWGVPPCRAPDGPGGVPASRECVENDSLPNPPTGFGPDGGETRDSYDDVDDYHGLIEGDGESNPLQDAEGNTRLGYDNFRVEITVRYVNVGAGEEEDGFNNGSEMDDAYDAKLITIEVFYRGFPDGYAFSAYKGNF